MNDVSSRKPEVLGTESRTMPEVLDTESVSEVMLRVGMNLSQFLVSEIVFEFTISIHSE